MGIFTFILLLIFSIFAAIGLLYIMIRYDLRLFPRITAKQAANPSLSLFL